MSLTLHLKIAGATLLFLGLAHAFFPRRFNWKGELSAVSPLNRQIFQVHCFFVGLVVGMFGLLALLFTPALLERTALARVILAGLVLFWLARLIVQLFVYDRALWRGHRFNSCVHLLFTFFWAYYAAIFGWALWRQFQPE
jgi:hypothetical protein